MITQTIDGVKFSLKEPFDFNILQKHGTVFKVFDRTGSGCICFGMIKNGTKKFVKVAGAKTVHSYVNQSEAVNYLKSAIQVYQDLHCDYLIKLYENYEIPNGYVAIFEWFEGECMFPYWEFLQYPHGKHPKSPLYKYKKLTLIKQLEMLDVTFAFIQHTNNNGYFASDFYDNSILYDFKTNTTKICDIDLYMKMPCKNHMGKMWGSTRFMSPEEFELGKTLDEVTNVYTAGATAFNFLGDCNHRILLNWRANEALFAVAKKAVSDERSLRHQSLAEFIAAWNKAKQKSITPPHRQ